jgi:hypothetical protein
MSIHEHLPPQARRELRELGRTKPPGTGKDRPGDRRHFDCATWLHKARVLPKEDFRREAEKELTGKEAEPSELIYFKLYKSQALVIEQAIETVALTLGTDKSRGYCLEMICVPFWRERTWTTGTLRRCSCQCGSSSTSCRSINGGFFSRD